MLVPRIPARCWSFCPRNPSQLHHVAAALRRGYGHAVGPTRLEGTPGWVGLVAVESGGTTVHAVGLDGALDFDGGELPRLRPIHNAVGAVRECLDLLAVGPVRDQIISGPPLHPIGGATVRVELEYPFSSGSQRCAFSPVVFGTALHRVRSSAIHRVLHIDDGAEPPPASAEPRVSPPPARVSRSLRAL